MEQGVFINDVTGQPYLGQVGGGVRSALALCSWSRGWLAALWQPLLCAALPLLWPEATSGALWPAAQVPQGPGIMGLMICCRQKQCKQRTDVPSWLAAAAETLCCVVLTRLPPAAGG